MASESDSDSTIVGLRQELMQAASCILPADEAEDVVQQFISDLLEEKISFPDQPSLVQACSNRCIRHRRFRGRIRRRSGDGGRDIRCFTAIEEVAEPEDVSEPKPHSAPAADDAYRKLVTTRGPLFVGDVRAFMGAALTVRPRTAADQVTDQQIRSAFRRIRGLCGLEHAEVERRLQAVREYLAELDERERRSLINYFCRHGV